ncbi:MAG: hypothetical protein ACE5J7_02240 [Candidatus Aenigmatarchaeota archaeon]
MTLNTVERRLRCPTCKSTTWKNGFNERSHQIYKCKKCNKQFTKRSKSKYRRARFPQKVIVYAVKLHTKHNLSSYVIAELLAMKGIKVSHVSVHKWIKKYGGS